MSQLELNTKRSFTYL